MASPRGRWKASGPWIQLQQSCLARRVCEETRLFALAVSLGAVESLIEHPATMTHASKADSERAPAPCRGF
jgi:cystathionine beta-lyase/cystathionine gamma-synthase